MAIRTVIFDLDGTITRPFLDFDLIREEMGLSESTGSILEEMEGMSPQKYKEAEDILYKYETKAVEESTLNDNAKETIHALRKVGINIGILTRNKRANALAIAEKHDLNFDAIIDREDGPVKPDPYGVMELCRQFGTAPAETIVVGDYLYDILSAKSAGAIGVLLKNHKNAEDFTKFANFSIDSLDQLIAIVENDGH